ncbi:MAG: acetyl-CoA carboxylase biotin carboxylase subunit [Planctomycetes bacterium]|nr:acetyl-CoA carboxylase biotin carboxylase subunit [Planctomycetota bacterium]MCC7171595.1 acetyl-CoA carboxylase biotin carboxylase subunit [Planctomycetota bacterium]
MSKLKKVLVANRGEIAVRVLRACREEGIPTVAVYSDADRNALHVRLADEAFCIGPPPALQSYLDGDKILAVAKQAGADSIHPGYGFLSENADFADATVAAGLTFIGPPGSAMRAMGNKISAKARMKAAKVPCAPGSDGAIDDPAEAKRIAESIGFPVMIKAASGGGGKGIRIVKEASELARALDMARSEAEKSFKSGAVYVEKFLEEPRHVEIQVLADRHGNVVHLGERECSVQRRHQKIVEETPSCIVDADLRQRMGSAAVAAARACGYENAGTVEFLVDKHRNFYFLEMNTRLQVEHPITEQVTGIDLVRAQLRIAARQPLEFAQADVKHAGHAIEVRICAEDPDHNFVPATGVVRHLDVPGGGRVRIDAGIYEGMTVGLHYDSMLAKLIVRANDREEAIARMKRALAEFHVTGVKTNIPFLLRVFDTPEFLSGKYDTGFIERNLATLKAPPSDGMTRDVALVAAAVAHAIRKRRSQTANTGGGGDANASAWLLAARREGLRR